MRKLIFILILFLLNASFNFAALNYYPYGNGSRLIFERDATTIPTWSGYSGGKITIYSARNEYEYFHIILRATGSSVSAVNVEVTPLVNSTGNKLDEIEVRAFYYHKSSHVDEWWPDGLPPWGLTCPDFNPTYIPEGKNQGVSIIVYVPPFSPADTYTGIIKITANGISPINIPLNLVVWDFTIPFRSSVTTSVGNWNFTEWDNVPIGSVEFHKIMENEVKEIWMKHRISMYNPYPEVIFSSSIDKKGTVSIDFSSFLNPPYWKKYMDWCISFVHHFPFPNSNEDVKKQVVQKTCDFYASQGWLEKGYMYVYDEPNGAAQMEEAERMFDYWHFLNPNLKTMLTITTLSHIKETYPDLYYGNYVDIWNPGGGLQSDADIACMAELKAMGKKIWTYCFQASTIRANEPNFILIEPRSSPIILWRRGFDGVLYYGIAAWYHTYDPWVFPYQYNPQDLDIMGDGIYIYPASKFGLKGKISGIRLENLREGLEDYEYLYLIDKLGDATYAKAQLDTYIGPYTECKKVDCAEEIYAARKNIANRILQLIPPYKFLLSSINIQKNEGKVNLSWEVNKEENLSGFNIYRATEYSTHLWDYDKLNKNLISPNGTNSYSFIDEDVQDFSGSSYYLIGVVSTCGMEEFSQPFCSFSFTSTKSFSSLKQYPNPFSTTTTIKYTITHNSNITLEIYNLNGELIKKLVDGSQSANTYEVTWDGTNQSNKKVCPGVYFYCISDGIYSETGKILFK